MAIVKNNAKPSNTWFGGVCMVPNACLVIDSTIETRVKQVSVMINDGKKVSAPSRNAIFKLAKTSLSVIALSVLVLIEINALSCAAANSGSNATARQSKDRR